LYMTTKDYIISSIKTNRKKFTQLGIRNVGLFGSYSRDEQSVKSDIDILIDFNPEMENFDNYMAVCDIFEQLFENEKVEIVTINGLSPYIGHRILDEVVYV
jgi:predicted nucleotidyltransferase